MSIVVEMLACRLDSATMTSDSLEYAKAATERGD
jgi:hypothetical protein